MKLTVSESVHLSPPGDGDISAYLKHLADPDISKQTRSIPHPYEHSDAVEWLSRVRTETVQYGHPVHWAVRNETGGLIGGVGFHDFKRGSTGEIGYWLAKPYWRRGIMTGVVKRVCEYAFREFEFNFITAKVFVGNEASICVLLKAGFRFQGLLKDGCRQRVGEVDSLLYGKTR